MSTKKRNRNKTGRRSKQSTPLPDPLNGTFCAKVSKSLGNCRFSVERHQDMGYINDPSITDKNVYRINAELSSSMKGGNRFNRVREGDNVLIEEQSYTGKIVHNSKKKNYLIIGVYTKGDMKRLKACGAFNQSQIVGKNQEDSSDIVFMGQEKSKVEEMKIDDDFINNI